MEENYANYKQKYLTYKQNLFEFVSFFLKHFLTSEIPEFHMTTYKSLPHKERLVLAAPRGHAKSTIVSVFYPLWLALFGRRTDITIISASETLAVEWLRKIKMELESNQMILELFGDLRSDKWTESHIILKNQWRVNIRARGAGGQIRGFRPDCVILDDIETDESVESEDQRKKLKQWLYSACLNTLLPKGQLIMIGTILHPLSLLNDCLTADNGWEKRIYRAYDDGIQEAGHELWEKMWSHEKLQVRKREIGTWAFQREYMNNPTSDETSPIKSHHIRNWVELPKQYSAVITVDPAYSDDEKADYKVASLIAVDQNMNRYLVTYVRTHESTGTFMDSIINLWLNNKNFVTGVGIPNQGVEKSFFTSFMTKCEQRKLYPPVVELKNTFVNTTTQVSTRNKTRRIIASLQPLFESGKYYINEKHVEAKEELLTIGSSRWDDLVDTMAYAEQIIQPFFFEAKDEEVNRYGEPVIKQRAGNYGY